MSWLDWVVVAAYGALMLGIGAFSCALIMAPVLNLLANAYGIGAPTPAHPNSLAAPQANLMASVARGLFLCDPGGQAGITVVLVHRRLQFL